MIMINLLPLKKRREVINEYRHRRLMIGGLLLALIVVISAFFLLPIGGLLQIELESLESRRDMVKADSRVRDMEVLTEKSSKVEARKELAESVLDQWYPEEVFDFVDKVLRPEVTLSDISFEQKSDNRAELVFQGMAQERQVLREFIDEVEKQEKVTEIEYSRTDLLRERDNDFTLKIFLDRR